MNPYPQKKVITFNKHVSDFSFFVNYAELDHLSVEEVRNLGLLNLSKVDLTGVAEALTKNQGPTIDSKGIKAHFAMDDSGLLKLINVELVAEKTLSVEEQEDNESSFAKLGNTISKLFGSESTKPDIKVEEATEEPETTEKPVDTNSTDKAGDKNGTDSGEAKALKPKIVILKEPIEIAANVLSLPAMTEEQFKASVDKLSALNAEEAARTRRETALNNLESFVIDAQQKLGTKEFSSCGTPEEVKKIITACSKASDWLYEEGADVEAKEYEDKLAKLKKLTNDIFSRNWEHKERPEVLGGLKSLLNASKTFLENSKKLTKEVNPEKDIFTEVEVGVLTKAIENTEKWMKEQVEAQSKLKNHEDVVLTVRSVSEKMQELDREVNYLLNKMKIWKPKKPVPPKEDKKLNETDTENIKPIVEESQEDVVEAPELSEDEPVEEEIPSGEDEHVEL